MISIKQRPAALSTVTALSMIALTACSGTATDGMGGDSGEFEPAARVSMIVPFAAGGGSDLAGRAIAEGLEEPTGSTVTVQNLVGGSGAVGYSQFLADTGNPNVLLASETALMTLPTVQDVEFDYKDFTPIMKVGEDFNVVVAAPEAPYETCKDVIDAAAENEDLTAATSGATGPDHIAWSLIEDQFDISLDRVTFESTAEVTAALVGGHIDVAATNPGEVAGQIESGDIKPLCALAPERYDYPALADIPTGKEQGIDVTFAQWRGFIAPGGISESARQYWIDAAKKYANSPAYDEYIESNMLQPQSLFGDEFSSYLDDYNDDVESVLG